MATATKPRTKTESASDKPQPKAKAPAKASASAKAKPDTPPPAKWAMRGLKAAIKSLGLMDSSGSVFDQLDLEKAARKIEAEQAKG